MRQDTTRCVQVPQMWRHGRIYAWLIAMRAARLRGAAAVGGHASVDTSAQKV
jgi:hypothetical protein